MHLRKNCCIRKRCSIVGVLLVGNEEFWGLRVEGWDEGKGLRQSRSTLDMGWGGWGGVLVWGRGRVATGLQRTRHDEENVCFVRCWWFEEEGRSDVWLLVLLMRPVVTINRRLWFIDYKLWFINYRL